MTSFTEVQSDPMNLTIVFEWIHEEPEYVKLEMINQPPQFVIEGGLQREVIQGKNLTLDISVEDPDDNDFRDDYYTVIDLRRTKFFATSDTSWYWESTLVFTPSF